MPTETIKIYFEPLSQIGGETYYHKSLVYTNSSGQSFLATAYPSQLPPSVNISTLSAATSAAQYGGSSPFGALVTETGALSAFSVADQQRLLGTPDQPLDQEVVASGANLSQQWAAIQQAFISVGAEGFAYSPLTLNSNSAASTALVAAGISLPSDTGIENGFLAPHWSPGSGVGIRLFISVSLALLLSLSAGSREAPAAEEPANNTALREWEEAIRSNMPHPSYDTTEVRFSVAGVYYRVPRNYILKMDNWQGGRQALVSLRINLPDSAPISADNARCFTARPIDLPPGCAPVEVAIEGPSLVSATQAFVNAKKSFRNLTPLPGPAGFEKYEIGPDEARSEEYRKLVNGRTMFFSCHVFDNRGRRDGVCRPVSDCFGSGNCINYFFSLNQLPRAENIDINLRILVERFFEKEKQE